MSCINYWLHLQCCISLCSAKYFFPSESIVGILYKFNLCKIQLN